MTYHIVEASRVHLFSGEHEKTYQTTDMYCTDRIRDFRFIKERQKEPQDLWVREVIFHWDTVQWIETTPWKPFNVADFFNSPGQLIDRMQTVITKSPDLLIGTAYKVESTAACIWCRTDEKETKPHFSKAQRVEMAYDLLRHHRDCIKYLPFDLLEGVKESLYKASV